MTPPWWTEADQAEWDLVIWAVVDGNWALPPGDRRRYAAWDLALDWWIKRHLVSKAEWFRRRHLRHRLAEIEELSV